MKTFTYDGKHLFAPLLRHRDDGGVERGLSVVVLSLLRAVGRELSHLELWLARQELPNQASIQHLPRNSSDSSGDEERGG